MPRGMAGNSLYGRGCRAYDGEDCI